MMSNLPETVSEQQIDEMFNFADKDNEGFLTYEEFKVENWVQYNYYGQFHYCDDSGYDSATRATNWWKILTLTLIVRGSWM